MVGGDDLVAEQLAEVACGALGHAPRVDEDQRRAVRGDEHRDPRRRPAATGRSTSPRRARSAAARARGRACGRSRCRRSRSRRRRHASPRRRRGSARPRRSAFASPTGRCGSAAHGRSTSQPLERQRQVAAALARGQRVDLVDDHRAHRREHRAARLRAEQHVQRFGRRHEDVRRLAQALRGVPSARCRRCARRCGSRRRPARAPSVRRGCRQAAPRG